MDVPSSRICPSCEARDAPISSFISNTKCIIRSIEYHQDDYIRYEANSSDQLTCSIGQISTFIKSGDGVKLRVYRLGRERDRQGPGYFAEVCNIRYSAQEVYFIYFHHNLASTLSYINWRDSECFFSTWHLPGTPHL